jgi:hypothetical protein
MIWLINFSDFISWTKEKSINIPASLSTDYILAAISFNVYLYYSSYTIIILYLYYNSILNILSNYNFCQQQIHIVIFFAKPLDIE